MQFQVLHLVLPRTMRFVAVHSIIIVVLLFGLGMGACSRTGWPMMFMIGGASSFSKFIPPPALAMLLLLLLTET